MQAAAHRDIRSSTSMAEPDMQPLGRGGAADSAKHGRLWKTLVFVRPGRSLQQVMAKVHTME